MTSTALRNSWHADGLRWIATLLVSAADRLERGFPSGHPLDDSRNEPVVAAHELYFDSDIYLAQVKDRAQRYL